MSSAPDLTTLSDTLPRDLLAVEPFTTLRFHFGMLLGVDDFEGLAANPRGKLRLHNAWLHKRGVVWGYGVSVNDQREVEVRPGLAMDGRGRELYQDRLMCLDVGAWYQRRGGPVRDETVEAGGAHRFSAYVTASYSNCLTRPVPAVVEPCDGQGIDTAYSRVSETVVLSLEPGRAPEPSTALTAYPHVAVLLSLAAPAGDAEQLASQTEIATRRDALRAASAPSADWLGLLREAAGRDRTGLSPARALPGSSLDAESPHFPELEPAAVVLAEIENLRVRNEATDAEPHWIAIDRQPDLRISYGRTSTLLPTAALQELLGLIGVR